MFEHLAVHPMIVVTGPQRSGTRIAARMIAADTGHRFVDETEFLIKDEARFRALFRSPGGEAFVVQAPHMLKDLVDDPPPGACGPHAPGALPDPRQRRPHRLGGALRGQHHRAGQVRPQPGRLGGRQVRLLGRPPEEGALHGARLRVARRPPPVRPRGPAPGLRAPTDPALAPRPGLEVAPCAPRWLAAFGRTNLRACQRGGPRGATQHGSAAARRAGGRPGPTPTSAGAARPGATGPGWAPSCPRAWPGPGPWSWPARRPASPAGRWC